MSPSFSRPEVLKLSGSLKKRLNILEPILNTSFKNQVSNDLVAQVNTFAYKDIINKKRDYTKGHKPQLTSSTRLMKQIRIKTNVKDLDQNALTEKLSEKSIQLFCSESSELP